MPLPKVSVQKGTQQVSPQFKPRTLISHAAQISVKLSHRPLRHNLSHHPLVYKLSHHPLRHKLSHHPLGLKLNKHKLKNIAG